MGWDGNIMSSEIPLGNEPGLSDSALFGRVEERTSLPGQLPRCSIINSSCYDRLELVELRKLLETTLRLSELDIVYIRQKKQGVSEIVFLDPQKAIELQTMKAKDQEHEPVEQIPEIERCIQEILLSEQGDFVCIQEAPRSFILHFLNIESRKIFEQDFKKQFEGKDLIRAPFKLSRRIYQLEQTGDIGTKEVSELNKIAKPYGLQVIITKRRGLRLCKIVLGKDKVPYGGNPETDKRRMRRLYPNEQKIGENIPLSRRQQKEKK